MRLSQTTFFLAAFAVHALAQQTGMVEVRTHADLEKVAAKLALEPYEAPTQKLDPFYDGLKYDDHRRIQFRKDKSLYADSGAFAIEMFHPGWMFKKPIYFHELAGDKVSPLAFDPSLFDYFGLQVPAGAVPPAGYSGFKLIHISPDGKSRPEVLAFQGASYFRAVTDQLGWGISARGIAVNTIGGDAEEFPDFTHFWFAKPEAGTKAFKLLALLNGPSVTGAYEFETMPGNTTVMKIKATLHLRKPVKMLGIAPFSSMYWFGENSHPKPYDFRPEVHDSDGLQVEIEGGPTIWRPLDVSRDMRLSLFETDKLKGFGLAERDRDFKNFEDLEANYHRRPAVWVEPKSGFGAGAVTLVELSTGEETWDNIVAMWSPKKLPTTPQEPLKVAYDIQWLDQHEPGGLCKVTSTRRGFVMDSDDHLYVIDFAAGKEPVPGTPDWVPEIELVVSGDAAKIIDKRVMKNAVTGGWRAFFKLDVPDSSKLLELMCELKNGDKVISERWMYQWRK
ncbi:MAG: glucan biosynthesis protein G [Verrucomicrobiaceae bacterium]|nr:glucan biosynthesis protein G [Verrucomicrobiaceae bacterium]